MDVQTSDPRGPLRTVQAVESPSPSRSRAVHRVTFECGHVGEKSATQAPPRVGEQSRCLRCGPRGRP